VEGQYNQKRALRIAHGNKTKYMNSNLDVGKYAVEGGKKNDGKSRDGRTFTTG
jgi:hypothetical protein